MRIPTLHLALVTGALMTLAGNALAGQDSFCLTGTISSEQQRIDCAGRWISADGTRFGPQIDPRDTPRTPHPGWRSSAVTNHGQITTGSTRTYSTHSAHTPAPVWTPQTSHYNSGAPVVITRGNHTNSYSGAYDVYVPTRHYTAPLRQQNAHHQSACGTQSDQHHGSYCGTHTTAARIDGCFSIDAYGQTQPVPCPVAQTRVYSSTSHTPAPHAVAYASAHASAEVNISSVGFLNSLSGGVGSSGSVFYGGGGGGTIVSGGGGSVLSRAPLIRFRSRNRGHKRGGHGCNCGGGMMGMGGGD